MTQRGEGPVAMSAIGGGKAVGNNVRIGVNRCRPSGSPLEQNGFYRKTRSMRELEVDSVSVDLLTPEVFRKDCARVRNFGG